MADELDAVTQEFVAEVTDYVDEVRRAADDARSFAGANAEAKAAVDGMRDGAGEAARAVGEVRDSAAETAPAIGHLRDEALEAAMALKITRDEEGKFRDASGGVITAAELEAKAMKHIRDQALEAAWAVRELDKYEKGGGFLSGLKSSLSGLLGGGGSGGGGGALSSIPLLGSPGLLLAIVPAVLAVVTEVGALATGLTAAGLGVGAFAVLAMPAFKSVSGAYTQINADQLAYNRALTATAKSTALAHLKQDYANLDPAQRGAVKGLQELTGEYHKLSKAFEPASFKVFNEGLKIANQLLPYIGQFANAAAPAIEGLLGTFSRGLSSPQFKYFMDFLKSLSGPVITAVGSGMKGLAADVMILMERFSKKDVINAVNIAFRLLGFAISEVTGLIMEGQISWDWLTQKALPGVSKAFDATRHAVANGGHDMAHTFDGVRHEAATMAHDTAAHFDEIRHDIAQWAGDVRHDTDMVVSFFEGLPHRIVSGLGDLGHLLLNAGSSLIHGLISGIEDAVPGLHTALSWVSSLIPHWKGPIDADAQMLVPHGMVIMQGLMRGIASQLPALRSQLAGVTGAIPGAIGGVTGGAAGGGGSAAAPSVHVTVPLTLGAGTQAYSDPRFLQYLQQVVQEAVLRYGLNNPGNGLSLAGGL